MAKETILILDTDKNTTWPLKNLLEMEKYPVIVADTTMKALKNFSEFRVYALITEYWVQNGLTLEVVQKLKQISPEAYVMMITDQELKEDEYANIIKAGVDDFFLKPVSVKKILLHLEKGLKSRDSRGSAEKTTESNSPDKSMTPKLEKPLYR
jgi:DNA-binding NtrC family response regulator